MLDDRDRDILAALQEDARATYADVAGRVGLSASAVHDRVRKLEQHGVIEAAVVGVPDALRGEVPVAFIVGDADLEELQRVCREQLASFKVPRRFVRKEELPKTALGKVQKSRLLEF